MEVAHSLTCRACLLSTPHNRRFKFRSLVFVQAVGHTSDADDLLEGKEH